MTLEIEATKSMTRKEMDLNENELSMKKLKRIFEVSSVICSAASINIVIACLYGGVPVILGFKSQEMIFDLAFSLLVASVVSFALAIATSRMQDIKMEMYFPSLRISMFISSLLKSLFCFKKKDVARCEKLCKQANTQQGLSHAECIENLKDKTSNKEYSNALENLSGRKIEDAEYSFENKNAGKSVFPPSSDKSSEIRSISQLQVRHTPIILGHCSVKHSPNFTKSRKLTPFDLKQMEKKSQILPDIQQTFVTNGNFNEVNTRNIHHKHPQVGIVSPIKINCSNDVKYFDILEKMSPSVEDIQICQKFPKKRFNPNILLEQESFYQNPGRMPNECFKIYDNILYENNASMKSFHKFPGSQREVFNNRLHTTHLQNLHEEQNKFPKVRCDESREISYAKLLQTAPEMSDEFSNKISGVGKFNLHKIQKVDSGNYGYKLHRKVTPNFKSFQDPLKGIEKTPPPRMGKNNHHINSKDWGENLGERHDIPMEICNTAPKDQVLEVSMKLKDLNFMF